MLHHQEAIRHQSVLDLGQATKQWTMDKMDAHGIPNTFGFSNRQVGRERTSAERLQGMPARERPSG